MDSEMSNPTILVESLAGTAGRFTITGPERYDSGLWLEEGTTNLLTNPSFETDTTGWSADGGVTFTRVTSEHYDGVAAAQCVNSGSGQQGFFTPSGSAIAATTGEAVTLSGYLKSSDIANAFAFITEYSIVPAGLRAILGPNTPLTSSFGRLTASGVLGASTASVRPGFRSSVSDAGTLHADALQLEKKPYATSYTAGTRAASSASVPTAGNIDSTIGSLAFRFTRKIDTGGIEYLLVCGTDGDDRLRIYVNTDDHLHISWDTGSALPQEVVSFGTIAVNTEYFVYTYWDETIIGLSIDNGETVVGVRDVPLGSWGTDPLTLQAT